MYFVLILFVLVVLSLVAIAAGIRRARHVADYDYSRLHSLPVQHGSLCGIAVFAPGLIILCLGAAILDPIASSILFDQFSDHLSDLGEARVSVFLRDVEAIAFGDVVSFPTEAKREAALIFKAIYDIGYSIIAFVAITAALAGFFWSFRNISLRWRARNRFERAVVVLLVACSVIAILTTAGIVLSLLFETWRFFDKVAIGDFLFGIHWSPQSAFEGAGAEAVEANADVFGAIPLFAGTLLITMVAILVSGPVGLFSAIYLSEYASKRTRP